MGMSVLEVKSWLDTLPKWAEVAVDDGGLSLVVVGHENVYLEVGGVPEDETDES